MNVSDEVQWWLDKAGGDSSFFAAGDIGNLMNVAGVGVLEASGKRDDALKFVEFLLSSQAQQFFTSDVHEYPVKMAVIENPNLEALETVLEASPRVDLDALQDLGHPLVLGASRKSFIAATAGGEPDERLGGSLAALAWAAGHRVAVVRAHDVYATVQFLRVWEAIAAAPKGGV